MERNLIFNEISRLTYKNNNSEKEIKIISKNDTDLDAPYKAGNFNFHFDGKNTAKLIFNTYYVFSKGISKNDQISFKVRMKRATEMWNKAVILEIKDKNGIFSKTVEILFELNEVLSTKDSNKITQVFRTKQPTFALLFGKDTGIVFGDLNVPIHFNEKDLAHELGHIWGLLDQYDRGGKFIGHVGKNSPFRDDTLSLMHNGDEFRGWFFKHIGKAILTAHKNEYQFKIPIISDKKVVANKIQGRIKLKKKSVFDSSA